jgi:hypothetical protein
MLNCEGNERIRYNMDRLKMSDFHTSVISHHNTSQLLDYHLLLSYLVTNLDRNETVMYKILPFV